MKYGGRTPMGHSYPIELWQAKEILDSTYRRGIAADLTHFKNIFFDGFLKEAEQMGFKYVSVAFAKNHFGGDEILGDGSELDHWPKIWRLANKFFPSCCGNANQYQIPNHYLCQHHEGKWDPKTKIRIGDPDRLISR